MKCKRCEKNLTGLQKSYCSLSCSKLHLKSLYRKRNRDKVKEYNNKWKKQNPDLIKLQKMRFSQRQRLVRIQSGELTLESTKPIEFKFDNKKIVYILTCHKCNDKFDTDRKRIKCGNCAKETTFKRLRFQVLQRDKFTCQYCGRKAPDVVLHVDHVLARSNGGSNTLTNLITACADCNLGKSNLFLT